MFVTVDDFVGKTTLYIKTSIAPTTHVLDHLYIFAYLVKTLHLHQQSRLAAYPLLFVQMACSGIRQTSTLSQTYTHSRKNTLWVPRQRTFALFFNNTNLLTLANKTIARKQDHRTLESYMSIVYTVYNNINS